MKLKFLALFLFSLFLVSCGSVLGEFDDGDNGVDEKTFLVSGTISLRAGATPSLTKTNEENLQNSQRTAIPSLDVDALSWEITATDTSSPAKTVSSNEVTKNSRNNTITFSLELTQGSWTVQVVAKNQNKAVLQGTSQSLSVYSSSQSPLQLGNVILTPINDSNATGSIRLEVSVESKIQCAKVKISDSSTHQNQTLSFPSGDKTQTISFDDYSPGYYDLEIKFYKGSDESSEQVFFAKQIVLVAGNMVTDTWNGMSSYINSGNFVISDTLVEQNQATEFYVKGTGGSNFSDRNAPSDSNNGSWANPFETLQHAVDIINTINDGQKSYTIYLDGTVTAPSNFSGNYFVDLTPPSTSYNALNLTIKSFDENSKAVIDANKKASAIKISHQYASPQYMYMTAVFENLIIQNGSTVNGFGGGCEIENANVTFRNCEIKNNEAKGAGGVYAEKSNVTFNNCKISGNKALTGNGGGVLATTDESYARTISFDSCTITQNTVQSTSGDTISGGGVYVNGVTANLVETTINANTAQKGSGVYFAGGVLNVSRSVNIGDAQANSNCIYLPDDKFVTVSGNLTSSYINLSSQSGNADLTVISGTNDHALTQAECDFFHLQNAGKNIVFQTQGNIAKIANVTVPTLEPPNIEIVYNADQDLDKIKLTHSDSGVSLFYMYYRYGGLNLPDPAPDADPNDFGANYSYNTEYSETGYNTIQTYYGDVRLIKAVASKNDVVSDVAICDVWKLTFDTSDTTTDINVDKPSLQLFGRMQNVQNALITPNGGKATAPDSSNTSQYVNSTDTNLEFSYWAKPDGSAFDFANTVITSDLTLHIAWKTKGSSSPVTRTVASSDITYDENSQEWIYSGEINAGGSYIFSGSVNAASIQAIMRKVKDASQGDDGGLEVLDFSNCTSDSPITINDTMFSSGDIKVKELYFPSSEVNLDAAFHLNTITCLEKVVIPNVSSIPDSCFSGLINLREVSIGGNVLSLGNQAFQNTQIQQFNIPSTCERIGNNAFSGCTGLTGKVTIPASCIYIGTQAFNGCTGISELAIEGNATDKEVLQASFNIWSNPASSQKIKVPFTESEGRPIADATQGIPGWDEYWCGWNVPTGGIEYRQ